VVNHFKHYILNNYSKIIEWKEFENHGKRCHFGKALLLCQRIKFRKNAGGENVRNSPECCQGVIDILTVVDC
jgi:hypothetical protein